MKKFFTILSIAAVSLVSAQGANLFKGSDFTSWEDFNAGVVATGFAVNSAATASTTTPGTLHFGNITGTQNGYLFTSGADFNIAGAKYIYVRVKGTVQGLSFNLGTVSTTNTSATGVTFNVAAGTTGDVTLQNAGNVNDYAGTINAADWITLKLDLSGVNIVDNKTFSVKYKKSSTNDLLIDYIKTDLADLAVGDVNAKKINLVKNTVVANELIFGATSKVNVYNMAGQIVKTAEVKEGTTLNVSTLAKGTYIVSGVVNGEAVSTKIIKK